jgi:predicted adenylyl cyclase CyaB
MNRNVEVKLKFTESGEGSYEDTMKLLEKIYPQYLYTKANIHQLDTFYKVDNGRLKLRRSTNNDELIWYDREESKDCGKLSTYEKCHISNSELMDSILSKSIGKLGEVVKERTFYIIDQTRVHFDRVIGLGDFLELEVVLTPTQTTKEGNVIMENILKSLKMEGAYIPNAYLDLLLVDSKDK